MSVDIRGERAEVVIDTEPSHRDWVDCIRRGDEWVDTVSGCAPCERWDDPTYIEW